LEELRSVLTVARRVESWQPILADLKAILEQ
jgi:hypothetical protein